MTRVSVIIPARGRARFVARAIASARRQTQACEIIVVDDGSNPPLSAQLPREALENVRLVVNPGNLNASYSRNQGVAAATSPIVAFLDSDDEWLPHHLETALDTCRFDDMQVYVTPLKPGTAGFIANAYAYLFGRDGDFRASGLICGRETFAAIDGFDAQLNKHQDWDFALRASERCRLYVGDTPTMRLDLTAPDRMSSCPNLEASRRFFERHRIHMSRAHHAVFWSDIIKFCAIIGDLKNLRLCKQWARQYIEISDLDPITQLCWISPRLSNQIFRLRYAIRNRYGQAEAV